MRQANDTDDLDQDLDARTVVRELLKDGKQPDPGRWDAILQLEERAVAPLIEVLEDVGLHLAESPGAGYAPVHAASLLGELRAAAAVEPMLRVLRETDWQDVLHDAVLRALPEVGPRVLEPALRVYAESDDAEFRQDVAYVLARIGVRDDRVFAVLLETLSSDPSVGAGGLAEYGDRRALEPLSRAFDAYEVADSDNPLANQGLVELHVAIETLGGLLTPAQGEKFHRTMAAREHFRRRIDAALSAVPSRPEPVRREARPGRNEPCWCGSDRKYKKCHLPADEGYTS